MKNCIKCVKIKNFILELKKDNFYNDIFDILYNEDNKQLYSLLSEKKILLSIHNNIRICEAKVIPDDVVKMRMISLIMLLKEDSDNLFIAKDINTEKINDLYGRIYNKNDHKTDTNELNRFIEHFRNFIEPCLRHNLNIIREKHTTQENISLLLDVYEKDNTNNNTNAYIGFVSTLDGGVDAKDFLVSVEKTKDEIITECISAIKKDLEILNKEQNTTNSNYTCKNFDCIEYQAITTNIKNNITSRLKEVEKSTSRYIYNIITKINEYETSFSRKEAKNNNAYFKMGLTSVLNETMDKIKSESLECRFPQFLRPFFDMINIKTKKEYQKELAEFFKDNYSDLIEELRKIKNNSFQQNRISPSKY